MFYKQFGITLIVAILISAINALTLSPVLCSLFLKPQHHDKEYEKKTMGKFFHRFNAGFKASTDRYGRAFVYLIRQESDRYYFCHYHGNFMVGKCFHEKRFRSNEDRGIIFTDVQLPAGTSMERTYNALKAIQQKPYKFRSEKRNHFYGKRFLIRKWKQ